MANRRFEDFEVGREFQHAPGRTVLDADNTWFTNVPHSWRLRLRAFSARDTLALPVPGPTRRPWNNRPVSLALPGCVCSMRGQDGVVVIEFERTVLLPKREAAHVAG